MGKTDAAADAKVIGSFGAGERQAKKSRAGWAKGKQIFFFFFGAGVTRRRHGRAGASPAAPDPDLFPGVYFPNNNNKLVADSKLGGEIKGNQTKIL